MDVRIDKWLWCVRLYKTRSQATEACRKGWVTILGEAVKPSRQVKTGELVLVKQPPIIKSILVKTLLDHRVAAKELPVFMEDQTPPEEYNKTEIYKTDVFGRRERGTGRPTKKERRELNQLRTDL